MLGVKKFINDHIIHNHVLIAAFVISLGWLIITLKEVFLAVFIAYIIMAALFPSVQFLKKHKFPNSLAVLVVYGVAILIFILLIFPLIPFLVNQLQSLFNSFPKYLDKSAKILNIHIDMTTITSYVTSDVGSLFKNAMSVTTKVFGGVFSFLTVFAISFYLLLDHDNIATRIGALFSRKMQKRGKEMFSKIEDKLGAWFRGQIVLSFSIGALTWISLVVLDLPYALPLALLAGILEIVPTIGPIISAIPAVIVALSISPIMALLVIFLYIFIQLLENNILVPRIMEKAVGLNPIVIILGVIVGSKLLGIAGALLSVPFISLVVVVIQSLRLKK